MKIANNAMKGLHIDFSLSLNPDLLRRWERVSPGKEIVFRSTNMIIFHPRKESNLFEKSVLLFEQSIKN